LADGLAYADLVDGPVPPLPGGESGSEAEPSAQTSEMKTLTQPSPERERAKGNMKGAEIPANRIIFSEKFACPVSGFTIAEIEPRLFSFNAPQGACPTCDGLGERLYFDPALVVPNENLSIKQGAVVP